MGRAAVRAAMADYFKAGQTAGSLPLLTTVFAAPPKVTPMGDLLDPSKQGQASGGGLYIHLSSHEEHRIAIGGATSGRKQRDYTVGLILCMYSTTPTAEQITNDTDSLIDSITAYIQANRTANSSAIFQWGEGNLAGAPDIRVIASMPIVPRLQGGWTWSTLEVTAVEILVT